MRTTTFVFLFLFVLHLAAQDNRWSDHEYLAPGQQYQEDHPLHQPGPERPHRVYAGNNDPMAAPGNQIYGRDQAIKARSVVEQPQKVIPRQAALSLKNAGTNAAGLDSSFYHTFDGDLAQIKRFTYCESGYLTVQENYTDSIFISEPFDFASDIYKYSYNDQGSLTSNKHLRLDHLRQTEDDYIVQYHYAYDYDGKGNMILYSYRSNDPETNQLKNITKWHREFDHEHDKMIFEHLKTGSNSEWINSQKERLILFPDGQVRVDLNKTANDDGEWSSGNRREYAGWINGEHMGFILQQWSYDLQDWINYRRETKEFNEHDASIRINDWTWDDDADQWQLGHVIIYERNNEQQIVSEIHMLANGEDELEQYRRAFYEYNEDGLTVERLVQFWHENENGQGEWVNNRRWMREYNEMGLETLFVRQTWEEDNGNWRYLSREEHAYDENGLWTFYLRQQWDRDDEEWQNLYKNRAEWDDHGRQLYYFHADWDSQAVSWVNDHRRFMDWTEDGVLLLDHRQLWSADYEHWYSVYYSYYELDERGELVYVEFREEQDPETLNWKNGYVYEYVLDDELHYIIEFSHYRLSRVLQDFTWYSTTQYVNDYYGNRKEEKRRTFDSGAQFELTDGYATYSVDITIVAEGLPVGDAQVQIGAHTGTTDQNGQVFIDMPLGPEMEVDYTLTKEGYETKEGTLYIDRHTGIEFTMIPWIDDTSIAGSNPVEISIYPNPARHTLNILTNDTPVDEVRIVDILGQVVFRSVNRSNHYEINVTGFRSGIYFVQLNTSGIVKTYRIQVSR